MSVSKIISNLAGPQTVLSYHRKYNWDLFMFFNMGVINGSLLSKFCQDLKFGDYSINALTELRWGGRQQFFPGIMEITRLTATFLVPSPDFVGSFFRAWRRKIVSDDGYYGVKADYARNIHVWIDTTTYFPAVRLILKKAFPLSVPSFDLSYSDEGLLTYTINFSIEKVDVGGVMGEAGDYIKSLLKF